MPFSVAFPVQSQALDIIIWVVDFMFFLDILVTFSTPVHIHGEEVTSRWIIATQYLKLHFWIDLIACIPLDRWVNVLGWVDGDHGYILCFCLMMIESRRPRKTDFSYLDEIIITRSSMQQQAGFVFARIAAQFRTSLRPFERNWLAYLNRIGIAIAPDNRYVILLGFARVLRSRKLVKLLGKLEKSVSICCSLIARGCRHCVILRMMLSVVVLRLIT
jgi:hypothetical protein